MQYLTKSFHSKFEPVTINGNETMSGLKQCIKKLNKWLAKSDQQDVKVDDFDLTTEINVDDTISYGNDVTYQYPEDVKYQYPKKFRCILTIIYHHE